MQDVEISNGYAALLRGEVNSSGPPGANQDAAAFWNGLVVHGAESEHFESLSEMAASADAVVQGRFVGFGLSRELQGDAPEDVVTLAVANFEVRERIRGREVVSTVPVEFLLTPTAEQPVSKVIEAMAAGMARDDAVIFLRKKRGKNDGGFYRLVNSLGLWTESSDGLATPLSPDAQTEEETPLPAAPKTAGPKRYARELGRLGGRKRLVDFANLVRGL